MKTVDVLWKGKYMRVVRSIRQSVCTRGLCGSLRCQRVSLEYGRLIILFRATAYDVNKMTFLSPTFLKLRCFRCLGTH